MQRGVGVLPLTSDVLLHTVGDGGGSEEGVVGTCLSIYQLPLAYVPFQCGYTHIHMQHTHSPTPIPTPPTHPHPYLHHPHPHTHRLHFTHPSPPHSTQHHPHFTPLHPSPTPFGSPPHPSPTHKVLLHNLRLVLACVLQVTHNPHSVKLPHLL